jgi:hypothetical protein
MEGAEKRMLLKPNHIKSILEKKPTFIKGFTILQEKYDFNFLSNFIDSNSINVGFFSNSIKPGFETIWQAKNTHAHNKEFYVFFDFFKKTFKYVQDMKDGVDLFFSFTAQIGLAHKDEEDVFLLGLEGSTLYRDTDTKKDYVINKGDLLFFPKQRQHKSISLTPRIILSVGFHGGKE